MLTIGLKSVSGEKAAKQTKTDPGAEDWLQDFKQAHPQRTAPELRNLVYDWLIEGNDTGLLAPTNCGKTTFVLQVAMDLAAGQCVYPLARQCEKVEPVRVVVFALEQNDLDIKTSYGDMLAYLRPWLSIHTGTEGLTPGRMMEIIKAELMAEGSGGVVVIIDNFTTLLENSNQKEVEQFCFGLNTLRLAIAETDRPLSVIKVFHAKKDVKLDRRFDQTYFRGDGKYLYGAQNVLYLNYCTRGNDMRVLGFIKRKNGDQQELNLLRCIPGRPNCYLLAGNATVKDLGTPPDEEEGKKKKVGRPSDFTDQQMEEWYAAVQAHETDYATLLKEHGVTRKAINQRRYNIRLREAKSGNKLFPKEAEPEVQPSVLQ